MEWVRRTVWARPNMALMVEGERRSSQGGWVVLQREPPRDRRQALWDERIRGSGGHRKEVPITSLLMCWPPSWTPPHLPCLRFFSQTYVVPDQKLLTASLETWNRSLFWLRWSSFCSQNHHSFLEQVLTPCCFLLIRSYIPLVNQWFLLWPRASGPRYINFWCFFFSPPHSFSL